MYMYMYVHICIYVYVYIYIYIYIYTAAVRPCSHLRLTSAEIVGNDSQDQQTVTTATVTTHCFKAGSGI